MNRVPEIPIYLREVKRAPQELFYSGNLKLLDSPKVAIVGGRRISQYTRNTVYNLSKLLSKRGFVVVSGGAIGTDIIAHRGAFPNTISVMANSLDIIYPKTNKDLILEMEKEALLLSEYEKNVPAHPKRFVHRNRLMVGLADFLIIGEADLKSGTAQTMRIAKEEGKELFFLPHRLGESEETNRYLELGLGKAIYNLESFVDNMATLYGLESVEEKSKEIDPFLQFCKNSPTYEELFQKFGDKVFEYELDGKIAIRDGRVYLE
jgi:DNA processing protein